jgi:hypothetical protein
MISKLAVAVVRLRVCGRAAGYACCFWLFSLGILSKFAASKPARHFMMPSGRRAHVLADDIVKGRWRLENDVV